MGGQIGEVHSRKGTQLEQKLVGNAARYVCFLKPLVA